MSFFDIFSTRKRKFQTALTILMAEYTYSGLSEELRKKIDDEVVKILSLTDPESPRLTYYSMPQEYRYGYIAAALKQMGIPPAIEGEKWTLIGNPISVDIEDPGFNKAVEEAIDYLLKKGIKLYPEDE